MPTSLGESNVTSTTATLTWTGPSNASTYQVRYKLSGSPRWTNKKVSTNALNVTGLLRGRNYQWVVNTKCTNGTSSPFTVTRTFTTPSL